MATVHPKHYEKVVRDLDARSDMVFAELHPDLKEKILKILEMFDGALTPYCGFRDQHDQEIAFQEKASKAHWLQSPHNYHPALACDLVLHPRIVPVRENHGWPNLWDNDTPEAMAIWLDLNKAAKDLGLVRYGWDLPHVELAFWQRMV